MGRTNGGTALLELQSHSQLPPVPKRPRLAPVRTRGRKLQRHDAALGHWLVGSHSARQACSPFRSSPSNRAGVGTPRRLIGPRSPLAKTIRSGRSRRLGIEGRGSMARLSLPGHLRSSLLSGCLPARSGPGLTGDGSIPCDAGIPGPPYGLLPPIEKAPLCRCSPLQPHRGHGVVVLFLRGSLPPCSPSGRKGGLVFFETPMAAAADSRTLLRGARDLPPPASQTALPCGPRSSELPDELLTLF